MKKWCFWVLLVGGIPAMAVAEINVQSGGKVIPIEQFKRVSATVVPGQIVPDGEGGMDVEMPGAVPYSRIEMPPLPEPEKHEIKGEKGAKMGEIGPTKGAEMDQNGLPEEPKESKKALDGAASVKKVVVQARACTRSVRLLGELLIIAYQKEQKPAYMRMVGALTLVDDAVRAGQVPNLMPLENAHGDLPWFGSFNRDIEQAYGAVRGTCGG